MLVDIQPARPEDRQEIRRVYLSLGRPPRRIQISDFLVARDGDSVKGCAAVRPFAGGGYLYGLAVEREWQRRGIGAALTRGRLERIRSAGGKLAVVMAMFWNVGFFRKLGFDLVQRSELPPAVMRLPDFRDPTYKRSAVLWQRL